MVKKLKKKVKITDGACAVEILFIAECEVEHRVLLTVSACTSCYTG